MVGWCTIVAHGWLVYKSFTWLACVLELHMVGLCTIVAHGWLVYYSCTWLACVL